jgi:hypothetical protein
MAKDIIFKKRPTSIKHHVHQHLKINGLLNNMKNDIVTAQSIKEAFNTLSQKYVNADLILIMTAIRETFQMTNEQLSAAL